MANGDYWNKNRREGLEGSSALGNLERILGLSQGISQRISSRRKERRNHFLTMADAITRGFESEFDNTNVRHMVSKLENLYNKSSNKNDVETRDAYKVYMDKLTRQLNENVEFDDRVKEWGDYSQRAEEFIDNMYQYSTASEGQKLDIINKDMFYQDALNNDKLDPIVMSKTDDMEKYEAWQTSNMKNIMTEFGGHVQNFGAKFYDRIPPSIQNGMADTQYYMNDILKGWQRDGNIDDFEYRAWSGLVKNGDDQALKDLNSNKEMLISKQLNNTNEMLTKNILSYNAEVNDEKIGRLFVASDQVGTLFPGNTVPAEIGVNNAGQVSVPLEWWISTDEIEKLSGEDKRIAIDKALVAEHFWFPKLTKKNQLKSDIEKGVKILNSYGQPTPPEIEGLFEDTQHTEGYNEENNKINKDLVSNQEFMKSFDINSAKRTEKEIIELADYIKSGYKNEGNFDNFVKKITRDSDMNNVLEHNRKDWFRRKSDLIKSLVRDYKENWPKAYNEGGYAKHYGELPISINKLYEYLEIDKNAGNAQNADKLLKLYNKNK